MVNAELPDEAPLDEEPFAETHAAEDAPPTQPAAGLADTRGKPHRSKPRPSDPLAASLFTLAGAFLLVAIVLSLLPYVDSPRVADFAALLSGAGASPGLFLAIACITLATSVFVHRFRRVEGLLREVEAFHETLFKKSEELHESLEEAKRQVELTRVDRFSTQLGQIRTELASFKSEMETRVLPAPEIRRSFEEQGGKFADLGKFLHRVRTEWLEEVRGLLQATARQADLAQANAELRKLAEATAALPKSSDLQAVSDEARSATRDVTQRFSTLEESLQETARSFASVETYIGSVSERLEGYFSDLRAFLEDERKRQPGAWREEWAKVQSSLLDDWKAPLSAVEREIGHSKDEVRNEIRQMATETKRAVDDAKATLDLYRKRLDGQPDAAGLLASVREASEAEQQAIRELRKQHTSVQEAVVELTRNVDKLPRKDEVSQRIREVRTDLDREFEEVRKRIEVRLAALEEFRGGISGIAEESRRIREAIHQVDEYLQSLRAQGVTSLAREGSAVPVGAAAAQADAASAKPEDSVFSAIEKLRSMKGE